MKKLSLKIVLATIAVISAISLAPDTAKAGHGNQMHWNGTTVHVGFNFGLPTFIHPVPPPVVKHVYHGPPRHGHNGVSRVVHHYPPPRKHYKNMHGHHRDHKHHGGPGHGPKHHHPRHHNYVPHHHR